MNNVNFTQSNQKSITSLAKSIQCNDDPDFCLQLIQNSREFCCCIGERLIAMENAIFRLFNKHWQTFYLHIWNNSKSSWSAACYNFYVVAKICTKIAIQLQERHSRDLWKNIKNSWILLFASLSVQMLCKCWVEVCHYIVLFFLFVSVVYFIYLFIYAKLNKILFEVNFVANHSLFYCW